MEVVGEPQQAPEPSAWATPLRARAPRLAPIMQQQQQEREKNKRLAADDADAALPPSLEDADAPAPGATMTFAAAAAASATRPPVPRSVSSVELAAIVNGASSAPPGVSAVPARGAGSSGASEAPPAPTSRPAASSKSKKSAAPAWHKSVFDMIQDDFPRTPSPMLSSLLSTSRAAAAAASGGAADGASLSRVSAAERRARVASSASLDLDIDRLGTATDPANDLAKGIGSDDAASPKNASDAASGRFHHRRSISINWTGDMTAVTQPPPAPPASSASMNVPTAPTQSKPLSRSSSRSTLSASPPNGAYFGAKPAAAQAVPTPVTVTPATSSGTSSVLPGSRPPALATAVSASTTPTRSLSPTGSSGRGTRVPSPPEDSPLAAMPLPLGSNVTTPAAPSSAPQHMYRYPRHQGIVPDVMHAGAMDDLNVSGIADYDYLYEQSDVALNAATPGTTAAAAVAGFQNQGYAGVPMGAQVGPGGGMGMLPASGTALSSASPYGNAFPSMGLISGHSPFSNSAGGIGNGSGVAPTYSDSFRDGLAAADNLKNMSIQMAAFLSAQQQLYAAQMAQMAAMTGGSAFSAPPGPFGGVAMPGGLGNHVGAGASGAQLRSPWDVRESTSSPHRGTSTRNKHHMEQYKNSGVGPMGGSQKKGGAGLDGHKTRGGRGRRGHRMHDDGGVLGGGSQKMGGDRSGMSNGGMVGSGAMDSSLSRSPLLEEFRSTSLSIGRGVANAGDMGMIGGGYGASGGGNGANASTYGREWQLSEIKDNVVEFATDQHGSRFIQQKLESASAGDKEAVLKHALTDAQRLMTDVFGNYVVQKLLDHGGESAVMSIAAKLEGRMLSLSLHMYGCRVVQKALEVLEPSARAKLVHELNGHVLKCIRDQNGNHVIQKCVELVESESIQFIVDAVQGQAVTLAGHSYGCRVVQRILEHSAPHQKEPIMVEIMASIADLIKDQYGNYVIQHVVEHGTFEERSIIMDLVRAEVCQLSQHKFASNVVERCLQFGSPGERQVLIEILIVGEGMPNASPLNHLVRDQFGNYVVQRVLDVAIPPQRERVVNILRAQVPAIKKYSYGKHIIARLEEHQQATSGASLYHQHGGVNHGMHRGDRHNPQSVMSIGMVQGHPRPQQDFIYHQ